MLIRWLDDKCIFRYTITISTELRTVCAKEIEEINYYDEPIQSSPTQRIMPPPAKKAKIAKTAKKPRQMLAGVDGTPMTAEAKVASRSKRRLRRQVE